MKAQPVNLRDFALNKKLTAPLDCTYSMHFESLDGNQPKIAETVEELEQYGQTAEKEQANM